MFCLETGVSSIILCSEGLCWTLLFADLNPKGFPHTSFWACTNTHQAIHLCSQFHIRTGEVIPVRHIGGTNIDYCTAITM